MSRPRLLDLFCGAGGAARGYQMAGFEVIGVDVVEQPRYAGDRFVQGDALELLLELGHTVDAIHASPPCQRWSTITRQHGLERAETHPDLVAATRDLLELVGRPWVIENVPGAPLRSPVMLCGSMFGLEAGGFGLRRHRLFETSIDVELWPPASCAHTLPALGVYGHPGGSSRRDRRRMPSLAEWRAGMGMPWAHVDELAEAIPPAYTRHVGGTLLEVLGDRPRAVA